MEPRRSRVTSSVRTEGGLLPADLLAKIAAADPDVPGLTEADFGLGSGERVREAITRSWNRLVGAWAVLAAERAKAPEGDPLTSPTRERFLLPLLEELGFGRLPAARAIEIDGTSYPISHGYGERVPVHLVGITIELDARTKGVRGAAGAAPHALVQEYLNRTDAALWGLVSNGRSLRLLRDSTSLTRAAYVEFDLEAIFAGELYADFALLWTVCHRSRFEGERTVDCLVERWTKKAADDGTRALDKLRGGVERSIETLGAGFLAHPDNAALRSALRSGDLDRQDYYRELLRLVYRLIFLFTAEDRHDEARGRELLLDPEAPDDAVERYRRFYSTARLRTLAARRRGTRHGDLWVALRLVTGALGGAGAPSIALPPLGSFLFGPGACPHLDAASLRNEDLLAAIRALTTIEEDRRLRPIDYRNLGAEELGSVYEGLLELHPAIEMDANPPRFELSSAAGNERKATGSYYTPSSLISCLLDSALDPVVDDAVKGKKGPDAEAALLGLAVVDPAAGSGHFLVAAAHRLAKRLAAIRTEEAEPPPAAIRHALRDVIAHCIYAADINPMAVELCKVSLWLEALEPGRPLSFLDAHIKSGNSLLGTTPELAAAGIPDAAYEALTGDDKPTAREWRKRNAAERSGQQTLFEAPLALPTEALAAEARSLDALPDESPAAIAAKAARHAAYETSSDYRRSKAALDAWCAAFVAPKTPEAHEITTAVVRALGTNPAGVPAALRETVERIAAEYAFFHWPLEFPAIFAKGGFDVVLGNPPWERVKLQEQEFFSQRHPQIAGARNASARKALIRALSDTDPDLERAFRQALRAADAQSQFLRASGMFPLAGRGDINTYAVFAEVASRLPNARGRAGLVLPTGIATDDTTKAFFSRLVSTRRLVSLFDMGEMSRWFADVGGLMRFCLMTFSGEGGDHGVAEFAFRVLDTRELANPERRFALSPDDFELVNPNTRTCPIFESRVDAQMALGIYRRVPVLIDEGRGEEGNPWGASFLRMFDMATDSGVFLTTSAPGLLPLYEAKMIHQYNHRHGDYRNVDIVPGKEFRQIPSPSVAELSDPSFRVLSRYWVPQQEVAKRLAGRSDRNWMVGWRDVTAASNERTVVSAVLPRVGVGHNFPLLFSQNPLYPFLIANLNSIPFDWVARQKVGGIHLTYFLLAQLPVLPPAAYLASAPWTSESLAEWLRPRLVELVCTSDDLAPYGRDLGWLGTSFAWDTDRRIALQAEIDAAFCVLYGLTRHEVEHMYDSFKVLRLNEERTWGRFVSRELGLLAFDDMSAAATAGESFSSRLNPPPGLRGQADLAQWSAWKPPLSSVVLGRRSTSQEATPAASSASGAWVKEAEVDVQRLAAGARVRRPGRWEGVVEDLRRTTTHTELRVRLADGRVADFVTGYGLLEFEGIANGD